EEGGVTSPDLDPETTDAPPLGELDRVLRAQGFEHVAGVDEAGRGALAGPLVAAAVILPGDWIPEGLTDSKLLTPLQRERLYDEILGGALAVGVRRVRPAKIDEHGLQRANIKALQRSLAKLDVEPDYVLVDGLFKLRLRTPSLRVIKGDQVSTNVAAASIVAKVTRDRMMVRYARRFPEYSFERNKGYGAPEHLRALDQVGPSRLHRRCFAPVSQLRLDLDAAEAMDQEELAARHDELADAATGGDA
ncbi:MAG: ribonuclease HII, partial [Nitriliruptorales bacterium]|nr:ribonuclease HII [Nitriliruptorales bacterium]